METTVNDQLNVEVVPPDWRRPVELLAQVLQDIAGDRVVGLCPFGLAFCTHHGYEITRLQSVVVLESLETSFLDRLGEYGMQLGELNVMAPLIMTPEYIQDSRDTFPLALMEIQQTGRTVHGQDYFRDLSFEKADVRLQCERVLKTVLIDLRQRRVASAGDESVWPEIYAAALEECYRVLRGLLWLAGQTGSTDLSLLISEAERVSQHPLGTFNRVRESLPTAGKVLADDFYRDVVGLADYANGLTS